ncbi:nitronate monooxygenase family protein [Mycobacterium kansasii 824]|nr:nitronate monooxygenase family protein [Mycobacterium kansasii 824]
MVDVLDRLRLDVPVAQAGMGGGIAGATLAAAVANAGGLGTLGLVTARQLRTAIDQVRAGAPGRAVAVNLLLPFLHRGHVDVCVRAGSTSSFWPSARSRGSSHIYATPASSSS